ncbi:uncharacterized protein LOC133152474 isoform X2 [Syngnathus typhle]|uniref:uncharacterized protein LOC133152474 isoform X2 n=1 Tax=Syngnathus typhle TaxID=161592 RepID=UPI002A6B651D|nr:uncharacterized protein LOC133152474 isoform X2 [Syngnathus typhle]
MKMSRRLFLLVITAASVCQGKKQTGTSRNRTSAAPTTDTSTRPMPTHQNRTWTDQPDELSTSTGQTPGTQREPRTRINKVHDPDKKTLTTPVYDTIVVSTIALNVSTEAGPILLVLLLLMIVMLLIILLMLRRSFRMYSFDLQRTAPGNHAGDPAGNFEALNMDDQVANNKAPQSEEHDTVFTVPQKETHINHSDF